MRADSRQVTVEEFMLTVLHQIIHISGCLCVLSDQAEDLRRLMHKMENWAHRLYPKLQFEEFIDKVEKLGKKKEVQVGRGSSAECLMKCACIAKRSVCNFSAFFCLQTCLKRIRLDMPLTHEDYMDNGKT